MTEQELETVYKMLRLTRKETEGITNSIWEDDDYQKLVLLLNAQIAKILKHQHDDRRAWLDDTVAGHHSV